MHILGNSQVLSCGQRIPRAAIGKSLSALMAGLLALALSACDRGVKESASDPDIDRAVAQAKADYRSVLKASGLGKETENGGFAVGYEGKGESAQMGQHLPVPDWLPSGFPLPSDLSIVLVSTRKDGHKEMQGASAKVLGADLARSIVAWIDKNGWEEIGGNDLVVTAVGPQGQVIDVRTIDGEGVNLVMSNRSVAFDRQRAAVEVTGPGTATVSLDGKSRTVDGQCIIKGSSYQFEHAAVDGRVFAALQIQMADTEPQGSASYQESRGAQFSRYALNFPHSSGAEPQVRAAGRAFSVRGNFALMAVDGNREVQGEFSVNCAKP